MKRFGVAVLGTGGAALEHMQAYVNNSDTDLVAVLSRDAVRAEQSLSSAGLSAQIYTEYGRLLADERIHIVSVCTPNGLHAEQAIRAAEAGKHVLIEKPMAITLADVRAVRDAVKRAGVKGMVGFVARWAPLYQVVRGFLDEGTIGDVFLAEVHYWEPAFGSAGWPGWSWWTRREMAGSSFLSGGCHAVDTMRSLVGSEATEVSAYSTKIHPDFDYNPTVLAAVRFENGALGNLSSTLECAMPYDFKITLLGTQGAIRDNAVYSRKWPMQTDYATIPTDLPGKGRRPPFQDEIDAFVCCVAEDGEPPIPIDDSVRTHELIFAIDQSAAEGRPVKLPLP